MEELTKGKTLPVQNLQLEASREKTTHPKIFTQNYASFFSLSS
jgi:hypothetical protein